MKHPAGSPAPGCTFDSGCGTGRFTGFTLNVDLDFAATGTAVIFRHTNNDDMSTNVAYLSGIAARRGFRCWRLSRYSRGCAVSHFVFPREIKAGMQRYLPGEQLRSETPVETSPNPHARAMMQATGPRKVPKKEMT